MDHLKVEAAAGFSIPGLHCLHKPFLELFGHPVTHHTLSPLLPRWQAGRPREYSISGTRNDTGPARMGRDQGCIQVTTPSDHLTALRLSFPTVGCSACRLGLGRCSKNQICSVPLQQLWFEEGGITEELRHSVPPGDPQHQDPVPCQLVSFQGCELRAGTGEKRVPGWGTSVLLAGGQSWGGLQTCCVEGCWHCRGGASPAADRTWHEPRTCAGTGCVLPAAASALLTAEG